MKFSRIALLGVIGAMFTSPLFQARSVGIPRGSTGGVIGNVHTGKGTKVAQRKAKKRKQKIRAKKVKRGSKKRQ